MKEHKLLNEGQQAELHKYIWSQEIEFIGDLITKFYTDTLATRKDKDILEAYFRLGGLIVQAADQVHQVPGSSVVCYDVLMPVGFEESPLWLSLTQGDLLITLDPPFVLDMVTNGGLVKQNDWSYGPGHGGVKKAYVLQCQLGETNGMKFQKGGLAFLQHLGTQMHWAQLFTLARVMEHRLAAFGTRVACMQANKIYSARPRLILQGQQELHLSMRHVFS